jgi:AAHS family benzoate transporter-like MFS transporter
MSSFIERLDQRGPSWLAVALASAVVVVEGYDLIIYGNLIPKLLVEPGWALDKSGAGYIGSLVYVGMMIGALGISALADRFGRRRVIIGSAIVFTVFTAACALATTPAQLGTARLLAGLGMGGAMPAAMAFAKERAPRGLTSIAITMIGVAIPIGGVIGSIAALFLLEGHGWRTLFWVGAGLSAAMTVVAVFTLPDSGRSDVGRAPAGRRRMFASYSGLFGPGLTAVTVLFAAAAFSNLLTYYGLTTWLTTVMAQLHYPLASALQFGLTLSAGAVIGAPLLAAVAERLGYIRVALASIVMVVIALVVLMLGPQQQLVLLAVIALAGAGSGAALNLLNAAVADKYPTELRATALGWMSGIGRVGAIAAPTLGGWVLQFGAGPLGVFAAFVICGIFSAIATVGLLVLANRTASVAATPAPAQKPALEVGGLADARPSDTSLEA